MDKIVRGAFLCNWEMKLFRQKETAAENEIKIETDQGGQTYGND